MSTGLLVLKDRLLGAEGLQANHAAGDVPMPRCLLVLNARLLGSEFPVALHAEPYGISRVIHPHVALMACVFLVLQALL